jgi:hypothetical protein
MSSTMYERAPRVTATGAESTVESSASAVTWAAIFAGAFVAASATVILVALGSGLGFAAVSPWSNSGASLTTFAVSTGVWLIVVQWFASAVGGYVTGRLRTKWVGTHTHEVFFRDTAHGLVTWAVATVIVAVATALAGSAAVGAGARTVAAVGSGAAASAVAAGAQSTGGASQNNTSGEVASSGVSGYEVDRLFRSERPAASDADARAEATRILARGIANGGDVPAADRDYLAQVVAARSGISQSDAEMRVNDVISQVQAAELKVRQAADAARKAAAATSICTALALLVGAFIASVAAALGGKQRDEVMHAS